MTKHNMTAMNSKVVLFALICKENHQQKVTKSFTNEHNFEILLR